MSVDQSYFTYPHRRHGMDHDRYDWSNLFGRKPVAWPGGARVALWLTPILQWYPLNMPKGPVAVPGGLTMPYPDFRHYSGRDYGNRVGIFRLLELFRDLGLRGSVAVNAAVAERYPSLIETLLKADFEIIGHGLDMGHLAYGGLERAQEEDQTGRALEILRAYSGQKVEGWLSPARSQSAATPDILTANGVSWCCDWANDDMPYEMRTTSGNLLCMPFAYETEDRVCLQDFHHTDAAWVEQSKDRFDWLWREAESHGGRVMNIPLHAWLTGAPYRIPFLRDLLEHLLAKDALWIADGGQIAGAFRQQQCDTLPPDPLQNG